LSLLLLFDSIDDRTIYDPEGRVSRTIERL
jgi:hypothetical protein